MNYNFSNKVKDLKPSAIREILKFLANPELIAFSAGNPSPESFPVEKMKIISDEIYNNDYITAFQYSITEGYKPLREQITERLNNKFNTGTNEDTVVITTGGQQGIDLTAKVLCNEGDTVICENPSFIGALNAFRAYNVNLKGVEIEADGINIEKLEKALTEEKNVKIIYLIPTFQNPSGITMSLEKRKAVIALAERYNVVILEDNPYGELRFAGEDVPTIKSLDKNGNVMYCSSFSKILSAGIRVGFICGNNELIQKFVVAKQVNDVHTNIFFQILASKFIETYGLDGHVEFIRGIYKNKCSLMVNELENAFKGEISFTHPDGGLFLWGTMDKGIDGDKFSRFALEHKIAVVGGGCFLPEGGVSNAFRLNYSTPSNEQIIEGVGRLKKAYDEFKVK